MQIVKLLVTLLLSISYVLQPNGFVAASELNQASQSQAYYVIELVKFGIHNDGTHPVETTKGINKALQWAAQNGKTTTTLPTGIYLIDKESQINMVSNMVFELPMDAVLKKETNAKENYTLMYVGYGIHNVTLKGGTYIGDKETHDYSKKEHSYTPGTHEGGYGIFTQGANKVMIDGVKAINFTGDGLILGGKDTLIQDLYEGHFIFGDIDDKGKNISNAKKVRTRKPLALTHAIFKAEREFELSNAVKLPNTFDLIFYKANGTFLKKLKKVKVRDLIQIPEGATQFHLVFEQANKKGAYLEFWNRVVSKDVVVKNSEFAYNRRQGITVGGADRVLIENNKLHHMKGTLPQSGIDLEGGFGENGNRNSDITIRNNEFYDNASYDLILYDGRNAIVEGNHFASKGAIGLAISDPFTGATIRNNHFDGTRIVAAHDATFINNKMNDSYTTINGPNIKIDGMEFTDSMFAISSNKAFGVSVSNVTINNNDKNDSGLSLWGKPIRLKNVTINGKGKLRVVSGGAAEGSVFDNLKVIGYNTDYGLALPPATYNNCVFEGAPSDGKYGSINLTQAGKYVFDGCSFQSPETLHILLLGEHPKLDVTIKNSSFELLGNAQAISIQAARNVLLENNDITAQQLTSNKTEVIRINDIWKRNEKHDVLKAVIRGNTIRTNVAAIGIATLYAGTGAPAYVIENNTLYTAKLLHKKNDKLTNNSLNP
ncbi:right-handed parallel beta-helix repeat-containing protein [Paenibacillus sinopodophylli]|uniref:right-handed parallel beta-helix repeat-containing protein n=1 Tax=Paenibacillus sinopodophylli TaxID=1837342 RepID=UPI00110D15FE|nr:right-handed parallel beta-helix repeat-containing protein [Paenibacillus sinopodophylli]